MQESGIKSHLVSERSRIVKSSSVLYSFECSSIQATFSKRLLNCAECIWRSFLNRTLGVAKFWCSPRFVVVVVVLFDDWCWLFIYSQNCVNVSESRSTRRILLVKIVAVNLFGSFFLRWKQSGCLSHLAIGHSWMVKKNLEYMKVKL